MSEYLVSLNPVAKKRYIQRLEAIGPYSPENEKLFTDSKSAWPQVEYGHIFGYFIQRPGVYTQQELLDWKSLQAYNFFQSGFVQTVLTRSIKSSLTLVTAKVNPSMKSPTNAYQVWIAVEPTGAILTAHCKCMAG